VQPEGVVQYPLAIFARYGTCHLSLRLSSSYILITATKVKKIILYHCCPVKSEKRQ
jgi:hypothetical protein